MTDEWQDIATAPSDGTHVDLWADGRVPNAFYRDGWTVWTRFVRDKKQRIPGKLTGSHRYTRVADPTHWRPLPEPPK